MWLLRCDAVERTFTFFALPRHPLIARAPSSALETGKTLHTHDTSMPHVTAPKANRTNHAFTVWLPFSISLATLHICRLSREPTIDDAYRLRKFATVLSEIRSLGSATTAGQQRGNPNTKATAERRRLPEGRKAREDVLFQLLSELESVESVAQAVASLGGVEVAPPAETKKSSRPDGAVELSASFQRRACDLCRDRAEQAARATAAATTERSSTDVTNSDSSPLPSENAAIAVLRFRAAAFELYTVLESVELNPAAEGEEDDPAFLPPGKRGWKHGVLCEEAAGWADMVRGVGGARGIPLPSAELPEFQVGDQSVW